MTRRHAPGPGSRRVAAAIAHLRRTRGLSRSDLAEQLDTIGRPLSETVLVRIERNDRPVDVDDLLCLAVALEVSPLRLLFGDDTGEIEVTPTWQAPAPAVRLWAQGATADNPDTDQARRVRSLLAQLQNEIEGDSGQH